MSAPYNATTMPTVLARTASLFDAVCIVCFRVTCLGQREAWAGREWFRGAVIVVDGDEVDRGAIEEVGSKFGKRLRAEPWWHFAASSLSHAQCVTRALEARPQPASLLILEADYAVWNSGIADALPALQSFVRGATWRALRLGYNPVYETSHWQSTRVSEDGQNAFSNITNAAECPSACRCEPWRRASGPAALHSQRRSGRAHAVDADDAGDDAATAAAAGGGASPVCVMSRRPGCTYCDVRSVVAYALHASGFDVLLWWGEEVRTALNYSLAPAVRAYAKSYFYALDMWLPAALPTIHYLTPALLTDGGASRWKSSFAAHMRTFATHCASTPPVPQGFTRHPAERGTAEDVARARRPSGAVAAPAAVAVPTPVGSRASRASHATPRERGRAGREANLDALLGERSRSQRLLPAGVAGWSAPVLWSFPGSGNTWTRSLLEATTGLLTGSVYNDRCLLRTFPGESECGDRLLAVKAHATDVRGSPGLTQMWQHSVNVPNSTP